ncbi:transmembrane protein 72 [Genypterus blacodes]|uniref:transmembrane protein 72 n=1 Tax=Genypterus blacodes TaxID=154954 RepID=UPI003F775649
MGNFERIWWIVVESICRILGVSTATVLCVVGVETLQQKEFHNLGIYLLMSSVGMMMFELAYFLDILLNMYLPCSPKWKWVVLCERMSHIGGFHKFLYYSIMSVVCFLHPVLVWHAVIPGTMLLVTAVSNFILSKKTKTKPPIQPHETGDCSNQDLSTICVTESAGLHSKLSFFHMATGKRGSAMSLITRDSYLNQGEGGESTQTMLEMKQTVGPKETEREKRWKGNKEAYFTVGKEPEERDKDTDGYYDTEPDTTSDTAPMITD